MTFIKYWEILMCHCKTKFQELNTVSQNTVYCQIEIIYMFLVNSWEKIDVEFQVKKKDFAIGNWAKFWSYNGQWKILGNAVTDPYVTKNSCKSYSDLFQFNF